MASLALYNVPLFFENRDKAASASPTDDLLPGNMPRELVHNGLSDVVWAALSALNTNVLGQTMPALNLTGSLSSLISSGAFLQPVAAQWLFGSAPMLIFAGGEPIYRKLKGETLSKEEIAKIWAPPTAAALAIPMWDIGQLIGAHLGATSSLFQNSPLWYGSSIAAGMIAAPFAGFLEGFTQWSVKYIFDVATNPVKQEMWRQKPALMGKVLVKELLLNVTIGAIPGAVWQVIFFFTVAVLTAALGPLGGIILAALLVGIGVMLCNFVCTHLINKASDAIDHWLGWDKELENLKNQSEKIINDQLSKKIVKFPQTVKNVDSPKDQHLPTEAAGDQLNAAGDQGLSG